MGRPSKRAKKVRKGEEFNVPRISRPLTPPLTAPSAFAWQLEDIRNAIADQQRGVFRQPSRLAKSMRTDDALFTAYDNRLDPQRNIGVELKPAGTNALAKRIANEAEALFGETGVGVTRATVSTINGDLANHGVAFGINIATPREDGSRIDFELRYWPIEWVRWDAILRCFVTQVEWSPDSELDIAAYRDITRGSFEIPIVHGDGRFVIFSKHEHEPWTQEACVMPGGLVWGARAFGVRDWGKSSKAHGDAKLVGEMAEGVALQKNGSAELTDEAQAFLDMLTALVAGELPVGIRPSGSKTDFVANASTAWQVFSELVLNRDRAAARIYLGTDGTLGAPGGAPGVDVKALFGVATTKVQGDLGALKRGLQTGTIEPWAAVNFGDSSLAPERVFMMPDADAEAERGNLATRYEAFHAAIERLRKNGFEVKQDTVTELARRFAVPEPMLPVETTKAPSITLAPTDLARVVSVNEARASAGLGPLVLPGGAQDPDGLLTVEEFAAKKAAKPTSQPAAPAPSNGVPKPAAPAAS